MLNGFVTDIETYAVLRFVAGMGLAGELGAGITLVLGDPTKTISRIRDDGHLFPRTCWCAHGELCRQCVRLESGVCRGRGNGISRAGDAAVRTPPESAMFEEQKTTAKRGDILIFFRSRTLLLKLLAVIAVGVPISYISGIVITFWPEFGAALNLSHAPAFTAAETLKWQAIGIAIGSTGLSGIVSEMIKSRKIVVWFCFIAMAVLTVVTLNMVNADADIFMMVILVVGLGQGYWTVFGQWQQRILGQTSVPQ